jgi:uncharacterized protein YegL
MKGRLFFLITAGVLFPAGLLAAGASQAASSANRGSYLAGLGRVIPPEEVHIDSYIAQVDYAYPLPQTGDLNVITAADVRNGAAYLLIGLKGKKESFQALPPMNLCFVIDISGSMAERDKLEWVRDSFDIFIEQVRERDFVSVVVFDNVAEILIPPARISGRADRDRFKGQVASLRPRGGTYVYQGMLLGYQQVQANYRADYSNRVILLTDGMDGSGRSRKDFLDINRQYKERGINISTIALGAGADINLMVDMAVAGGGSSRFISDRDVMEETFGSELDRLVVSAARDLAMELALEPGARLRETWGYEYWTADNRVHYKLDTLHNGDYETIVAVADLETLPPPGTPLGTFSLEYTGIDGTPRRLGPYPLTLTPQALRNRESLADPRIREAEGFIALGKGLIDIGNRAAGISADHAAYQTLRQALYAEAEKAAGSGEPVEPADTPESAAVKTKVAGELGDCLALIRALTAYLSGISEDLGGGKYADELRLLADYETSFSRSYDDYTKRPD